VTSPSSAAEARPAGGNLSGSDHTSELDLTILMPCLNEHATVGACIDEALGFLDRSGLLGEVLIADNGSTDGSIEVAVARGARVVAIDERGYGHALRGGIAAATGRFVVMADCDLSYDFAHLDAFVDALEGGADLVVGNRFRGGIEPGAMPALNRHLGNPVLSYLARRLFRTPGMEFASEMIIRCAFADLRIVEVPTTLRPDGRDRSPHLRPWSDGWRHLRLLLLYSPRWLFLYPGVVALAIAGVLAGIAMTAATSDRGLRFGIAAIGLLTIGLQQVFFAVISKVWGARLGLLPGDVRVAKFADRFRFGWALLAAGAGLCLGGAILTVGLSRHGIDAIDVLGVGAMFVAVQFALNSCLVAMSTL
jgi:glycosyltransferase involved in cell wall biosynthesis